MDQPSPTPPPSPASDLPPPKKRDTRGGQRPGAGLKKGAQLASKRTYDAPPIIDAIASRVLETGSLALTPSLRIGPVTADDRQMMQRVVNMSAEEFNGHLIDRLKTIASKVSDRIIEKLDNDEFKTSELGFILSVAVDKRATLDGSRQLNSANIHNQILVIGDRSRDELMGLLEGRKAPAQLTAQPLGSPTSQPRPIDASQASIMGFSDASRVSIPSPSVRNPVAPASGEPIDVETAPDRTQRPQDRPPSAT